MKKNRFLVKMTVPLLVGMTVGHAGAVGHTAPLELNGDKKVSQYQDSLSIYKARLDSLKTLQNAYTAFDRYRLFSSSTFYNEVAQQKFALDSLSQDSINHEIDNALMNIYLKHPELIRFSETELTETGAATPQISGPFENTERLVEKIAEPQDDIIPPPEPEVVVKKPNFWTYKGDFSLLFQQNYVSDNWYKGGESNYSAFGNVTLEANYNNKQKVTWDNKLEMKLGFMTTRSDSLHKFRSSEDLLRLTSKVGLQATKKWYYTFELLAYSQFTRGYKSNDPFVYSDFCSPLIVRPSLGMSYHVEELNKRLRGSIRISPLTYNFTYVGRLSLATRNGVDEGKHTHHELGSSFTADLEWDIADNIKWKTRLNGFTPYYRTQLEWENTFSFKLNKYFSTNLFLYPRFDDTSVRSEDMGYWQMQEYFSLGFNFSF